MFNQVAYLISSVAQISTIRSVFTDLGGELNIFKMYLGIGLQALFIICLISLVWFCAFKLKSKKVLTKKEINSLTAALIFQILLLIGFLVFSVYSFVLPLYNLKSLF